MEKFNDKNYASKVVHLDHAGAGKYGGKEHKNRFKPPPRIIAIASGKGGVGKTNIVANLGYALSRMGKKTIILDADLGLGNLDVLLGLTPAYNLSHVITGRKTIEEVMIDGPANMKILPASSGVQELTNLSRDQQLRILMELDVVSNPVDVLLIDTAAGISSNVIYFSVIAKEVIIVVSPEPTAITDAYALMKVLSLKYSVKDFYILVNPAESMREAYEVFRQLKLVAARFLSVTLEHLGCVLYDENINKCVRLQKVVSELFPDSRASRCYSALAKRLMYSSGFELKQRDFGSLWATLSQD